MRFVNSTILTVLGLPPLLGAYAIWAGIGGFRNAVGPLAGGDPLELEVPLAIFVGVPGVILLWAGIAGFLGRSAGWLGTGFAILLLLLLLWQLIGNFNPARLIWQVMAVYSASLILAFSTPSSLTLLRR